jgi:GWxTD domain-containing protein
MKTFARDAMFDSRFVRQSACLIGLTSAALTTGLWAASGSQDSASSSETAAKPLNAKEQKRQAQKLHREQAGPWKKWLTQDVVYIISDEEKATFRRLQTDEERQQFVEQFWVRRNPTPDDIENPFREEHYRRIAYASYVYASGLPGWKTDRGMTYITCGPPDEIDSHPRGGPRVENGGVEPNSYPFEDWRYRRAKGDIVVKFIDTTITGEYHMTMDQSKKGPLASPGNGLSQTGTAGSPCRLPESTQEFNRIETHVMAQHGPAIKFKDLNAVADSTIRYATLPMQVQIGYTKVTDATDLCNISVVFNHNDLQFTTNKGGIAKATVNLYGRITSPSRRPVNWFEDTVEISLPAERMLQAQHVPLRFIKSIPIPPGAYRLNIVAKDPAAGTLNNTERDLEIPRYNEEQLGSSSVILADVMQRQPTKGIDTGTFVIGSSEVRPRVSETFRRGERVGIYVEFYNFGMGAQNPRKPDASVDYEVVNTATNQSVFAATEELGKMENASPSLVVVEKPLPLNRFEPGSYSIRMKVVDRQTKQTLTTPPAKFTVTL